MQAILPESEKPHRNGKSSTGKYSFPCTTFQLNLPQDNIWTDRWEGFVNGMKCMLQLDEETHGPSQELNGLCDAIYAKVIPVYYGLWGLQVTSSYHI